MQSRCSKRAGCRDAARVRRGGKACLHRARPSTFYWAKTHTPCVSLPVGERAESCFCREAAHACHVHKKDGCERFHPEAVPSSSALEEVMSLVPHMAVLLLLLSLEWTNKKPPVTIPLRDVREVFAFFVVFCGNYRKNISIYCKFRAHVLY